VTSLVRYDLNLTLVCHRFYYLAPLRVLDPICLSIERDNHEMHEQGICIECIETVIWWDATRVKIWYHKLNVYLGINYIFGVKKRRYPPSADIRSWSSNTNAALIIVSDWQYRLVRVSCLPNRDIAPGHFRHCKTSAQATVMHKV
jgi:hypothetical protein